MTQINISGQAPGGQPQRGQMSDAQRAAAERANRYTQSADYQRAQAQVAGRAADERKAYAQKSSQDAKYERDLDRLQKEEIKLREKQISDMQRDMRQHRANLQREQRLQHNFENLSHRASKPLTPSSWNAVQRAIRTSEFQNRMFRQSHGRNAIDPAALDLLRMSSGDEAAAHLRLGSIGQRYAEDRGFYKLGRVDAQLRHIERTLDKQLEFETNPARQASLQRQKDALLPVSRADFQRDGGPWRWRAGQWWPSCFGGRRRQAGGRGGEYRDCRWRSRGSADRAPEAEPRLPRLDQCSAAVLGLPHRPSSDGPCWKLQQPRPGGHDPTSWAGRCRVSSASDPDPTA